MNEKMTWEEAVQKLISDDNQKELVEACYYDSPLLECAERFYNSNEWQATLSYLPSNLGNGIVLDIGAGRGIASYALAKDGWKVTSLEPDPSNLVGAGAIRELSKDSNLDISITMSMGEALPFEDETYDVVYLRQVLHHANNLQQLCNEVQRVLKKGGIFIAVREHVIDKHSDLQKFFNIHPLHNLYGGENAYLLKEYINSITKSGLTITKILPPYSNPINLAPWDLGLVQNKLYEKTKIKWPIVIVKFMLKFMDKFSTQPGRLYSFIGIKE
jgi:ubiquinone/menaquinone biosynthesis C-methylase UbiE